MENLKDYKYIIISAYTPAQIRNMDREIALSKVGLYDGVHFEQAVVCPKCGNEMYVVFNNYDEPEVAQCMSCPTIEKVFYTTNKNFILPWRKAGD